MRAWRRVGLAACLVVGLATVLLAQGRQLRRHTEVGVRTLRLHAADQRPPAAGEVTVRVEGPWRVIETNGVPAHKVGRFPGRGNPNAIRPQRRVIKLPAEPKPADQPTPLHLANRRGPPNLPFGVAVNGVLFDPGTAEWWQGDRRGRGGAGGWNYAALGGAVTLGLDANHAHVQSTGAYHYHGLPTGLLETLKQSPSKHSPLVGWAADGFPVYAVRGYEDPKDASSKIIEMTSSYKLKQGDRPGAPAGPGGRYDGTFVQDYEYVEGAGTLDECSGRFTVTPEFPDGTYAYFLTKEWPVVPRAFRGEPINLRGRR